MKKFTDFQLNEKEGVANGVKHLVHAVQDQVIQKTLAHLESQAGTDIDSVIRGEVQPIKFDVKIDDVSPDFPVSRVTCSVIKQVHPFLMTPSFEAAYMGDEKELSDGTISFSFLLRITVPLMAGALAKVFSTKIPDDGAEKAAPQVILRGDLYHEFTHAYEDWRRKISKKPSSLSTPKEFFYDKASSMILHMNEGLPEIIRRFLFNIYATASYEINARVAQVEAYVEEGHTREERIENAKSTPMWNIANDLIAFKAEKFREAMIDEAFESLKQMQKSEVHHRSESLSKEPITKEMAAKSVDRLVVEISKGLFSQYEELLSALVSDQNAQKNAKFFKDIVKNQKLNDEIYDKMHSWRPDMERLSKKDAHGFLRYWEKKFNTFGEKLRRKLLKVVASEE